MQIAPRDAHQGSKRLVDSAGVPYHARMTMWRWFAILVTVAAMSAGPSVGAAQEPTQLPNLTLTPLSGGEPVLLSSFEGRPVLVTFWASWCGPCRVELPEFEKLQNRWGDGGLAVVAINVDRSARPARQFMEKLDLSIPAYRVSRMTLTRLGLRSLPTNFLLNPDGGVEQVYEGYAPQVIEDIESRLSSMLEPPGKDGR